VKVPVFIRYRDIEDICDCDGQEGIICDDYKGYIDIGVDDVEFDNDDLEEIVKEYGDDILEDIVEKYLDDIADILMEDKRLLDKLLRKLNINTW
jgi:hypothetical protein